MYLYGQNSYFSPVSIISCLNVKQKETCSVDKRWILSATATLSFSFLRFLVCLEESVSTSFIPAQEILFALWRQSFVHALTLATDGWIGSRHPELLSVGAEQTPAACQSTLELNDSRTIWSRCWLREGVCSLWSVVLLNSRQLSDC